VAGTLIGEPEACSTGLAALITARLLPLRHLVPLRDTAHTTNILQLQLYLIRMCACTILNHWARTMPPGQTAAAAAASDTTIGAALSSILSTASSPRARALLALLVARLPARHGGLGATSYSPALAPRFASSFISAWPTCCRVCPNLADLDVASSPTPTLAAFTAAYATVLATLASVRARFAALDANTRTWVNGSVHSAYHPKLRAGFALPDNPARLFDGAESQIESRCSQRSLSAIFDCDAWLSVKDASDAFDAANPTATCRHREATRLVSCSQAGAALKFTRPPDTTVKGSIIHSSSFLTTLQRHLGLYVTALAPILDARAADGVHVSEHARLGDEALNAANHTPRHNAGLHRVHAALCAVKTDAGAPRLGDRGDGTPTSKAEAKQRHAYLNAGHIPDIYRVGRPNVLWEFKCPTPFVVHGALGLGSERGGGAASTSDGHFIAFGNTLENLVAIVFGLKARGAPTDRALDRRTGLGRVDECGGDYADALAKGSDVHLLVCESTSALDPGLDRLLRYLAAAARLPDANDTTQYGASRTSPQSFYGHHAAAIACAVAAQESLTIHLAADKMVLARVAPAPRAPGGRRRV